MLKTLTAVIVLSVAVQPALAQRSLPLIKATSKSVDIRDKGVRRKNAWTIVPEAKPDVYFTSSKNEKVTFYTDLAPFPSPLHRTVFTTL